MLPVVWLLGDSLIAGLSAAKVLNCPSRVSPRTGQRTVPRIEERLIIGRDFTAGRTLSASSSSTQEYLFACVLF